MSKVRHLLLDTGCSLRHFQKLDPPIWPLFCRSFTVTTVYKKWLPTQISCEFKILDNLGATMSKIKITSYQGEFFLFYSQNSRYNCVILGSIIHFSIYYSFCYINEYWGLSLRALYPSMIKCCADNLKNRLFFFNFIYINKKYDKFISTLFLLSPWYWVLSKYGVRHSRYCISLFLGKS